MKLIRFQWPCHCESIKWRFRYMSLCFKSLFYNNFDSSTETAFAPVIICVDFILNWFGRAFVTLVVCLITSVVVLFYLYVLPYVFETYSSIYSCLHILYGHYLLMMISFHYYKSVMTKPGKPPAFTEGVPMPSICKKCILPKPPRAHHCSVCKMCRLKMDHHCPWINNCVGHFNHRYFISFCLFMLLGTIYVSLTSWVLFSDCFHFTEKINFAVESFKNMIWSTADIADEPHLNVLKPRTTCTGKPRSYNTSVVFLWILCSAVTMSLGVLTVWHCYLISVGETSIENLVNKRERERLKKLKLKLINRYHFGIFSNWKDILGFNSWRSFIMRVLLPSLHLPLSDGVVWEVTSYHKTCLA